MIHLLGRNSILKMLVSYKVNISTNGYFRIPLDPWHPNKTTGERSCDCETSKQTVRSLGLTKIKSTLRIKYVLLTVVPKAHSEILNNNAKMLFNFYTCSPPLLASSLRHFRRLNRSPWFLNCVSTHLLAAKFLSSPFAESALKLTLNISNLMTYRFYCGIILKTRIII
jgi:hypothetical protein